MSDIVLDFSRPKSYVTTAAIATVFVSVTTEFGFMYPNQRAFYEARLPPERSLSFTGRRENAVIERFAFPLTFPSYPIISFSRLRQLAHQRD